MAVPSSTPASRSYAVIGGHNVGWRASIPGIASPTRRSRHREVCAALGLAAVAPNDDNESLAEYVARCNDLARSREFFHAVPIDGDAFVFVKMSAEGFSALVANGFIEAGVG